MDGSPFSEYASPHARGRTMPAHECCVTKGVPRRSSCSGRACAPRQMRGPLCSLNPARVPGLLPASLGVLTHSCADVR